MDSGYVISAECPAAGWNSEFEVEEGLHPVGTQQIKDENGNDDTDRLQWDRQPCDTIPPRAARPSRHDLRGHPHKQEQQYAEVYGWRRGP